jgi:hypothetical protein
VRDVQRTGRTDANGQDDLRSLAVALEIEQMIRDGQLTIDWPPR